MDENDKDGEVLEYFKGKLACCAVRATLRKLTTALTGQSSALLEALEDDTRLPWEILHIAEIAFEVSHPSGSVDLIDTEHVIPSGVLPVGTWDRRGHCSDVR